MSNPQTTNVMTMDMVRKGIEALSYEQPELPPEQTIGDPSTPMSDFERVIRHSWAMHGGRGNPPKVIVSDAMSNDMLKLGCPAHLMATARRL